MHGPICPCSNCGGGAVDRALSVIVAIVVLAVGGDAIVTHAGDILAIAGGVTASAVVVSLAILGIVLHRNRFGASHRAEIGSQAERSAIRLVAVTNDVGAQAGRRPDPALVAQYLQGLTDGAERKPVLQGQVILTGEADGVSAVIDQPGEDPR